MSKAAVLKALMIINVSKAAVLGSPVTLILRFPAHPVSFFFDDRLAPADAVGLISEGIPRIQV